MLDGLQTENRALFDLVQLQEKRINFLKAKLKEMETERDILLTQLVEKDADPSSGAAQK